MHSDSALETLGRTKAVLRDEPEAPDVLTRYSTFTSFSGLELLRIHSRPR